MKNPYDGIKFEKRVVKIRNDKGDIVFEREVEFPDYFSENSVNIVTRKYLANTGKIVETSLKQMIDRVSETIAKWGKEDGYFSSEQEYEDFLYKLKYYQVHQYMAFNSPVYFNVGIQEHPQVSACFILKIEDTMESIGEIGQIELTIFKNGSGSGINYSPLRASTERVRESGLSSGPLAFLRWHDIGAGATKSGGTFRRSAKLACLNNDHPDIFEFVRCKIIEENKLRALKAAGIVPYPGYEMKDHVYFQNTNLSVGTTDKFMKAVEENMIWSLIPRKQSSERFLTHYESFPAKDLFDEIVNGAWEVGCPGLLFLDTINKWNTCKESGYITSSNPCITGDTLVATTCGKAAPIKDLAKLGNDILVYTIDKKTKEIKISRGMHPRKTGTNMPVYRVTLDDGTTLKTTYNHKLILRNGKSIEVKDLKIGDSLMSFNMTKQKNGDYNTYLHGKTFKEHRLLADYKYGRKIDYKNGEVVHHKDGEHENNILDNITIKGEADHSRDHISNNNPMQTWWPNATDKEKIRYKKNMSRALSGKKNGRYLGISNEKIKNHVIKLTKHLKRMVILSDWREYTKKNNLPLFEVMSEWRKAHLYGGLKGLFEWAANKQGYEIVRAYNSTLKKYFELLEQGYDAYIENNTIYVRKKCRGCGKMITKHHSKREICFCPFCTLKRVNMERRIQGEQKRIMREKNRKIRSAEEEKELKIKAAIESTKNKALACGNMLLFMEKNIDGVSWNSNKKILKEKGLKKFIQRDVISKYWNNNWNRFKRDCRDYNHKVVSIEFDGYEDVYNLTVDKYHNYAIVTNYEGDGRMHGIMSANCGEFLGVGVGDEACNLASINLLKFFNKPTHMSFQFDERSFEDVIETLITAQDILIDRSSFPTHEITKNSREFRPLGMGFSNLHALLMYLGIPYDSNEGRAVIGSLTSLMTSQAYKTSMKLANIKGAFAHFEKNKESMLNILHAHYDHSHTLLSHDFSIGLDYTKIVMKANKNWAHILNRIEVEKNAEIRNSQVTLIAPTGTISFLMGCETFGIQPEYSLVKYKNLNEGDKSSTIPMLNQVFIEGLRNLGYLEDEIASIKKAILEENKSVEDSGIKKEHLPIFDTEMRSRNRSLGFNVLISMMATVQPLISGAISSTINVPNDTTREEIYDIFFKAWKMGLKGITIYRDGSKSSQPLTTKKEEKKVEDKTLFGYPCKGVEINIPPKRTKLPNTRKAINHRFQVGGCEGYLGIGEYPDGKIGEIFITVSKQGSTLNGLLDSLAITTSMYLQYGLPLYDLVRKMIGTRFEPAGFTDNKDIRLASSIIDYIYRFIGITYLKEEEKIKLGLIVQQKTDHSKEKIISQTETDHSNPLCPNCGQIMSKIGSCYNCLNCGESTGSCG